MNVLAKLSKHALALAFVATSVAAPSVAFADPQGPRGTIIELEINHSTSDNYLQHHGRMVVKSHKTNTEYRWGGVACGSRTLTEHLVGQLVRALESGLQIVPRYQNGQGSTLCLTGFTLVP